MPIHQDLNFIITKDLIPIDPNNVFFKEGLVIKKQLYLLCSKFGNLHENENQKLEIHG
jgi:hypothetical protein